MDSLVYDISYELADYLFKYQPDAFKQLLEINRDFMRVALHILRKYRTIINDCDITVPLIYPKIPIDFWDDDLNPTIYYEPIYWARHPLIYYSVKHNFNFLQFLLQNRYNIDPRTYKFNEKLFGTINGYLERNSIMSDDYILNNYLNDLPNDYITFMFTYAFFYNNYEFIRYLHDEYFKYQRSDSLKYLHSMVIRHDNPRTLQIFEDVLPKLSINDILIKTCQVNAIKITSYMLDNQNISIENGQLRRVLIEGKINRTYIQLCDRYRNIEIYLRLHGKLFNLSAVQYWQSADETLLYFSNSITYLLKRLLDNNFNSRNSVIKYPDIETLPDLNNLPANEVSYLIYLALAMYYNYEAVFIKSQKVTNTGPFNEFGKTLAIHLLNLGYITTYLDNILDMIIANDDVDMLELIFSTRYNELKALINQERIDYMYDNKKINVLQAITNVTQN